MYMGRYFEGGDCDNLFPFGEWRLELCLGSLVMVVKKLLFCLFSFSFFHILTLICHHNYRGATTLVFASPPQFQDFNSSVEERNRELRSKDEGIRQMERIIEEKSNSIAFLLQQRGSLHVK